MTIRLPVDPTDKDYEDLVAACLTAFGYFVEANMVLRSGGIEVLEFDAVATPAGENFNSPTLIEAKSGGDVGFPEIFRLSGWMTYTGIERSCLVHRKNLRGAVAGVLREAGDTLGVGLRHLSLSPTRAADDADKDEEEGEEEEEEEEEEEDEEDEESFPVLPSVFDVPRHVRDSVLPSNWYARIAERVSLGEFQRQCRKNAVEPEYRQAREYLKEVQEAFFSDTPIGRARRLYTAYMGHPNVCGNLIDHVAQEVGEDRTRFGYKLWDTHEQPGLQFLMLLQHKARFSIIKNALHHVEARHPRRFGAAGGLGRFDWDSLFEMSMPDGFKKGMDILENHPHRTRIPYLLQIFLEVFGGFLHPDHDEDLELLACASGVPSSEVVGALSILDTFFPYDGGWFLNQKGGIRILKLVPGIVRGAGSFMRRIVMSGADYEEKYPSTGWLLWKWHRALYKAVYKQLKIDPPKGD